MSDNTIALYKKARRALSKKPRDVTALDRETVKAFLSDTTGSDSRMEYFELLMHTSAMPGANKQMVLLVKNLDCIGKAIANFTEGKPIRVQIQKLLPRYMQQWIQLAKDESIMYQTYIESSEEMRKLFQNAS